MSSNLRRYVFVEWARGLMLTQNSSCGASQGGSIDSLGMLERVARTNRDYRSLNRVSTSFWPISKASDRLPGWFAANTAQKSQNSVTTRMRIAEPKLLSTCIAVAWVCRSAPSYCQGSQNRDQTLGLRSGLPIQLLRGVARSLFPITYSEYNKTICLAN